MLCSFALFVSSFVCIGPEKPRWGSGQVRYLFIYLFIYLFKIIVKIIVKFTRNGRDCKQSRLKARCLLRSNYKKLGNQKSRANSQENFVMHLSVITHWYSSHLSITCQYLAPKKSVEIVHYLNLWWPFSWVMGFLLFEIMVYIQEHKAVSDCDWL